MATDDELAEEMYSLAISLCSEVSEIYINEAIAASYRDFSSAALPLVTSRSALGSYIKTEMSYLAAASTADVVIMSGLKADKLDDLELIVNSGRVKLIAIAGSLAMAIKGAQDTDFSIGRAATETDAPFYVNAMRLEQAGRILKTCQEQNIKVLLPVDFILESGDVVREIPVQDVQLDIGPETADMFEANLSAYVADAPNCKIFYNGVPGKFEDQRYQAGTRALVSILMKLAATGADTYVGGGEGRQSVAEYGDLKRVTHAFTAGGTVLKALSGRPLPMINALSESQAPGGLIEDAHRNRILQKIQSENSSEVLLDLIDNIDTGWDSASRVLMWRVGDRRIQEDDDLRAALCDAMVSLGILTKRGNLNYKFVDPLPLHARASALDFKPLLPKDLYRDA